MGKPGSDFGKVIDDILARLDAIEKARANELQWIKPKLRIAGVPDGISTETSVTAWWVPLQFPPPGNVWLSLDGEPGAMVGPHPETKTWSGLTVGQHAISAFLDGEEVARELWIVRG